MAFVVLDGVSPRHVNDDVMPRLTRCARAGGWCPAGIPGVMPSSTYPNHATFVTGVVPADHGVVANAIPTPGGTVAAEDRGASAPTLFDSMRVAGRPAAAVYGDHHLVGVTAATGADYLWPEDGFDAGVATDVLGYAEDGETIARMRDAVVSGADLIVAQLNQSDTAGHLFGPDSPEALSQYGRTDAHLGGFFDWLGERWDAWVVIVVSDHSQESVTVPAPVDLRRAAERDGRAGVVADDGAVSVVGGPMARDTAWITGVPGVEGVIRIDDETVLAWAGPGRWFSSVELAVRGVHGSPRTAPQVAVVTGGHPAAGPLAAALEAGPASSTWWAPTVAGLLGITAPAGLAPRLRAQGPG